MTIINIPGEGQVRFPDSMSDQEIEAAVAQMLASPPPPPVGLPREMLRGFNRGVGEFGDLMASPVREASQAAFGVPFSETPVQDLMRQGGMIHDPQSRAGQVMQTLTAPLGSAAMPAGGLARLAQKPAQFIGAELASALGAGAGSTIGEQMGGETGKAIGGIAGGFAPAGASGLIRRGMRGPPTRNVTTPYRSPATGEVMQRTTPDTMTGRMGAFQNTGVTPSAGQLSGTHVGRGIEAGLAAVPGGTIVAKSFAGKQQQQLKAAVEKVVRKISQSGVPTATEAGAAIQEGVEEFGERMGVRINKYYEILDSHVPATMTVPADNTLDALTTLTTPTTGMEATSAGLIPSTLKTMAANLAEDLKVGQGTIPYEGIKRLRTLIGEKIGSPTLSSEDTNIQQLRRLYAALSEDMKAAADAAGPAARRAFDRANRVHAKSQDYMKRVLEPAVRKLGDEDIFTALERGNRDGATKLNKMRQALTKDQWNTVAASIVNRMGRATPGRQDASGTVFSVRTFMTNWAKLSPEARRAILPKRGHRRAVDDLTIVAQRIDEGAQALANPSGTSNRLLTGATIAGGMIRPDYLMEIAMAVGTGVGGLKLMTNQAFVRWLSRSTKLPLSQIPAHVERLADVVKANPSIEPAIREYIEALLPEQPAPAPAGAPP